MGRSSEATMAFAAFCLSIKMSSHFAAGCAAVVKRFLPLVAANSKEAKEKKKLMEKNDRLSGRERDQERERDEETRGLVTTPGQPRVKLSCL